MKLIGICGDIGSGKDAVANHLMANHGFDSYSFAKPLKDWVFDLVRPLGVERRHIFGDTPKTKQADNAELLHMLPVRIHSTQAKGPEAWTGRALLEYLGTEVARGIDPDVWVNHFRTWFQHETDTTREIDAEVRIVIPDVRFPNEFDAIGELGGEIWRTKIVTPHDGGCMSIPDWRRACSCGAIRSTGHESDEAWRPLGYDRLLAAPKPGVDTLTALADVYIRDEDQEDHG